MPTKEKSQLTVDEQIIEIAKDLIQKFSPEILEERLFEMFQGHLTGLDGMSVDPELSNSFWTVRELVKDFRQLDLLINLKAA